jgi:hypothetical protein
VKLVVGGREAGTRPVRVEPDWLIEISDVDRATAHDTALTLHRWQEAANEAADRVATMSAGVRRIEGRLDEAATKSLAGALDSVRTPLVALRQRLGVVLPGERRGFGGGAALPSQLSALKGRIRRSRSRPRRLTACTSPPPATAV